MIRRNVLVYVEVIMEWQLSLKSNIAAKIYYTVFHIKVPGLYIFA